MERPIVIGLVGYKQAGKTSSVQIIKDYYGAEKVNEIMLAGKLKKVCSQAFNIPLEHFESQDLKEVAFQQPVYLNDKHLFNVYRQYGIDKITTAQLRWHESIALTTPRKILQYIGTEVLRSVEEEIHCRIAAEQIQSDKINVVSDVRFYNEYAYFQNKVCCDFYPLYIQRKLVENQADGHASELDIPKIAEKCERINSNESLVELKDSVQHFLSLYCVGHKYLCESRNL